VNYTPPEKGNAKIYFIKRVTNIWGKKIPLIDVKKERNAII